MQQNKGSGPVYVQFPSSTPPTVPAPPPKTLASSQNSAQSRPMNIPSAQYQYQQPIATSANTANFLASSPRDSSPSPALRQYQQFPQSSDSLYQQYPQQQQQHNTLSNRNTNTKDTLLHNNSNKATTNHHLNNNSPNNKSNPHTSSRQLPPHQLKVQRDNPNRNSNNSKRNRSVTDEPTKYAESLQAALSHPHKTLKST
ncbi:hypothetical protein BCR33DRAFT_308550 [Rhizoclosmatium globosum]|uniref:Uncharacterized protein n=1 Tax=Rhizoclosmatium globosum TaxID=329046 RepID=A0A1Y2C5Y3_9FUNG|nr:hypothetical protein BCR33DRAFT_308550 [Rhizoclosmatium globosum]|eukprot:ORY42346.1 hypothetical protein BCR33DRAFT_308550 [Rhizoclosmatium globosum]